MAVFNISKDPVSLKKISLRIWRLRDEIESIIQSRVEKGDAKIDDLAKEYTPPPPEKKTSGEISLPLVTIPAEKTSAGKAIISEINMEGIRFFCNSNYLIGNSLVIEFQIPKLFRLNSVVLETKTFDLKSKLISDKKLPFRIHLKWTFLKPGERTLLRGFLQSISLGKPKEKEQIVSEEIESIEEKEQVASEAPQPVEEKKSA
jgi:hypothetical protein